MPNPFERFPMEDMRKMSAEDFKREVQGSFKDAGPVQLNHAGKIAELAHYLVNNHREDLIPGEHVIDTAIRLLTMQLRPI